MKDKDSDGDNSDRADSGADVDGNKKNVKNQHDENMDPLTSALSLARKGVISIVENENMDPQQQQHDQHEQQQLKQQPPTPTNTTTTTAAPKSSNTSSLLIISILSGPHASQTYKLQPKHTQPCLIGRSKGKKFLRNGISLSKDQEVSTTHGKFSVEEVVLEEHEVDHDDGNMDNYNDSQGQGQVQVQKKFYYTDVGSTNGSTVGEARLEANVRVEIEDGMELRIGNSTLKIVFG